MESILHPLIPMHELPGMADAIATAVSDAHGKVCAVCGLERMGHAPESEWLGYKPHAWAGVPATKERIEAARELTVQAYRARSN